jgi:cytochrome c
MTVHRIHGGLVPLIVGLALIALATPNLAPAQSRSLGEALAAADAAKGETVFAACRACHTIEEGGGSMIGPNLWGVVGRPVAHVDGFNYSEPLKAYGGTWQVDRLDAFLADPQAVVPGSLMVFPGVKNSADRANLIAYLNQNSPSPLSLADAPGASAAAAAPGEDVRDYGVLIDAPGVEKTFAYCTACHSEMIVAQQGKTRRHWADLLEWMVEEQGMTPIEEPDLTIILDYLAANYNEDRPNFPRR